MSDREKLIELLESAESAVYWNGSDLGFIQKIADHLLSNGVTFQKWIPVSERLPEKDYEDVLAFDGISGCFITFMKTTRNGKRYFVIGHDEVTHWMSLPEPPKENDNEM